MKKIPLILALLPLLWCAPHAHAAEEGNALAAADANGGYAGQVLALISRLWTPPPDTINRRVAVRLRIDSDGNLAQCELMTRSDMPEMNRAACAAAKEAGNFGVPPYGMPIEVYVTFWTGKPSKKSLGGKPVEDAPTSTAPKPEPKGVPVQPAQPESARTAPKPEPKGVPVLPAPPAKAPEKVQASEKAEKTTPPKSQVVLPAKVESPKAPATADTQAKPSAPTKPEVPAKSEDKPVTSRGGLAGDKDAATTPIKSSTSKASPTPKAETVKKEIPPRESVKKDPPKKETTPKDSGKKEPAKAEKPQGIRTDFAPYRDPKAKPEVNKATSASTEQRRYAAEMTAWIQARIVPPAKLPSGKYTMAVAVDVGGTGDISEAEVTRSSGQPILDEAVLRTVLRMEKVAPPPDKRSHDLKLTLTVHKP